MSRTYQKPIRRPCRKCGEPPGYEPSGFVEVASDYPHERINPTVEPCPLCHPLAQEREEPAPPAAPWDRKLG